MQQDKPDNMKKLTQAERARQDREFARIQREFDEKQKKKADKERKRNSRRGKFAKVYLAFSLVVLIALGVAAMTLFFKVGSVEVVGSTQYSAERIAELSGISMGDNLILLDGKAIQDRLLGKLVFLRSVKLSRKLPDTAVLTVTEAVAEYAFEQPDGGYWLADADGRLLELRTEPGAATVVAGVELSKPAGGSAFEAADEDKQPTLEELITAISATGLSGRVDSIDVSKIYEVELVCDDGAYSVFFGSKGSLTEQCGSLVSVLEMLKSEGTAAADIDLSGGQIRVVKK